MSFPTHAFDLKLFLLINQEWRSPVLDVIMPILSSMTALFVAMALVLTFMIIRHGKGQIIFFLVLLVGMGATDFTSNLIKKQAKRVRPLNSVASTHHQAQGFWDQRPANFVQVKETGSSFPSAHSSNTMVLAILAIMLWPALKKWPLILPMLVGYSRVYLGKHYPVDVFAGWLLGILVAYAVWMVWKRGLCRFMPDSS
ncbi:MAG: phosphatase PAP2 family protein [Pseudodesulfovibrio sp.]